MRTRAVSVPLLFAVSLGAACDPDVQFRPRKPGVEQQLPAIEVVPPEIQFGELASVDREQKRIKATNIGYDALTIDGMVLTGDAGFSFVAEESFPKTLLAGESWEFDVAFAPDGGGDAEGLVTVYSDADNADESYVDLFGRGAVPELLIEPSVLDLGDKYVPCGTQGIFTLTNVGTEPLDVTSIVLETADGRLSIGSRVPENLTLVEGQSWDLAIDFDAEVPGATTGRLVVQSTDPAGERTADVEANGVYASLIDKQYDVPEVLPLDIIFAVDQSCSMQSHQTQLNSQIGTFIQALDAGGADWKVGVLTLEDGCFRKDGNSTKGWLTPQTSGWEAKFKAAVQLGTDHGLTEALLGLTSLAMDNDDPVRKPGGCNIGFRTPGAPLHIIFVSDERDQSSGYATNPMFYFNSYSTRFQSYGTQSVQATVRAHAVVDLNPNGGTNCSGPEAGPAGYVQVAGNLGGFTLDVCEPQWPSQLGQIAQQAVDDLYTFKLGTAKPYQPSMVVELDGVPVTEGWVYDPAQNAIVFDDPPPGNSTLDISFGVAVTCSP
ncbi:MAG: choice-of-anchor D domain-containing protein [Alphaproteobacteria bacterium]|nr:choice-of-anchor D domain-containing protein [Alphaproteobacteria bacterium]